MSSGAPSWDQELSPREARSSGLGPGQRAQGTSYSFRGTAPLLGVVVVVVPGNKAPSGLFENGWRFVGADESRNFRPSWTPMQPPMLVAVARMSPSGPLHACLR